MTTLGEGRASYYVLVLETSPLSCCFTRGSWEDWEVGLLGVDLTPVGSLSPPHFVSLHNKIFFLVSLVLIATGESESKWCIVLILFLRTHEIHELSIDFNRYDEKYLLWLHSPLLSWIFWHHPWMVFQNYCGKSTLGIWKVQELCETGTFPLVHCGWSRWIC